MSQAVAIAAASAPLVVGRYALFDELAAGGMATVHLGRLIGPVGFGRTVAVKRLHAHFLKDPEFITMFMDEARIVARIRHPNVVPMVDVVQSDTGLFLVMEYVHGESLSRLMRNARKLNERIPPRIVASIMCGVLLGLHAAHDTKAIGGELLGVVHRDVSPQNVIVGLDGTARVLDFGIAKAAGRAQVTREGQIKGKLAYMAPEQIRGQVDRRTDVFAAAVVLWEMLTGRRLHEGAKDVEIVTRVVEGKFPPPSTFAPELPPEVDEIVMRALARDPAARYGSARELALELERKIGQASPSEVSAWVEHLAHDVLEKRSDLVRAMELAAGELVALATHPPPVSLALPEEVVSWPGDIPVDFGGELSETSAMFAHSQTSTDASQDAHRTSRHPAIGAWGIVAVSCLLALIGIALGAYALLHRSPRETLVPPSGTSHSDHATGSAASPPPSGSASAALVEAPSADVEPKPPAAIATAATETTATAAPPTSAPAAALPRPSQGGPAVVPVPAPVPKKPPPSKPACDPPYTVDDVGHRHYKPECMGLD